MRNRKPLVILSGEIKTPPFSEKARIEAGVLLGGASKRRKSVVCGTDGSCADEENAEDPEVGHRLVCGTTEGF
jgi:hypothetical protein